MCTLHLFYQVFEGAPILFAANRDEDLGRPWKPPAPLTRTPRAYGPRDLSAGGTWLGVNEWGLLVSLANHHGTLSSRPSLCSRGTLVLEALRHESAEQARRFAEWAAPACKAYTLLLADPVRAYVVDHGKDGTQTYRLLPGCHVITNERFRDPSDPKAARSLARMQRWSDSERKPDHEEIRGLLSDHERAGPDCTPLCIHPVAPSRFGTSSASVIEVAPDRRIQDFAFVAGPPCAAPFQSTAVSPDR